MIRQRYYDIGQCRPDACSVAFGLVGVSDRSSDQPSSQNVTGPSLVREIFISAPNVPVFTAAC